MNNCCESFDIPVPLLLELLGTSYVQLESEAPWNPKPLVIGEIVPPREGGHSPGSQAWFVVRSVSPFRVDTVRESGTYLEFPSPPGCRTCCGQPTSPHSSPCPSPSPCCECGRDTAGGDGGCFSMCHEIRHFWSFNDRRDQDDGDMDTEDKDGDTDTEEKRRTGDGSVEEEASVPLDGDSYLPGLTEDEGTPVSFEGKLELWEEKEVEVEVQRRNYPNEINIELEVNNPKSRASEEESQTPLKADNLSENLSGSTTGSLEANLPTLDSASSSRDHVV